MPINFDTLEEDVIGSQIDLVWLTTTKRPCGRPDGGCAARHGKSAKLFFWMANGMPGTGWSECQRNCGCELVPDLFAALMIDEAFTDPVVADQEIKLAASTALARGSVVAEVKKRATDPHEALSFIAELMVIVDERNDLWKALSDTRAELQTAIDALAAGRSANFSLYVRTLEDAVRDIATEAP